MISDIFKIRNLTSIMFCLVLITCDNPGNPTTEISIPVNMNVYGISSYRMVNFDSLMIWSNDSVGFQKKYFSHIVIGRIDENDNFILLNDVYPAYTSDGDKYILNFSNTFSLDQTDNVFKCELRFYHGRSSFISDFLDIETYKYPYHSAELFIDTRQFDIFHVQDFYLWNNHLYFLPTGGDAVSRYDMRSLQLTPLFSQGSGTLLTGNDSLLFHSDQFGISRFNLITREFDVNFNLRFHDIIRVTGLTLEGEILYAIIHQPGEKISLARFNIDGTLLGIGPYGQYTLYMAMADSIIYSLKRTTGISRFDMRRNIFLETMREPSEATYGIFIRDDYLYFADFPKRMIGRMPVADLKPESEF